MLVPEHENVKASKKDAGTRCGVLPSGGVARRLCLLLRVIATILAERATKIPARGDGQGFLFTEGTGAYFAAGAGAPRVSSTMRWMRWATPSGRLTSPIS